VLGLFFVVWGGMFGGIPLAILLLGGPPRGADSTAVLVLFPLLGFSAFLGGLYLVLRRKEVRFDAQRGRIEERASFLGSTKVTPYARSLFDRASLFVVVGDKGSRSYKIELRGPGRDTLELGEFQEHNEALTAGMRAARRAGLAFEEKREGEPLMRLEAAELAAVPAASAPEEAPWWRRSSALALLAANLVPVWGVLYAGWDLLPVMLLFWLENLVVGAFNIVKILLARGAKDEPPRVPAPLAALGRLFVAAFFTFHYGMFCLVHGLFVVTLFGREQIAGRGFNLPDLPGIAFEFVLRHGLIWAVIALAASHGFSFYRHYLAPRAYEDADPGKLLFEPYKRVVILHVVILFGGFAAAAGGSSAAPLLLLLALKIAVDLGAHQREHAMPYEREMRDYMAEHAHRYLTVEPPAAAPAARSGGEALERYLGAWRAAPESAVAQGWIARAEIAGGPGSLKVRLWSQAAGGVAPEGEFDAVMRGSGRQVDFIEARQRAAGRIRIARFTGSAAGDSRIDLNEIQHPEGKPGALQANSLSLQRA
jgi:hypothetical protein